jgi:hypothetical protein
MKNTGNLESDLRSNKTIKLVKTIGSPLLDKKEPFANNAESLELYNLAVKNKISLLYLEILKQQGKLNGLKTKYDEEYASYLKFLEGVGRVTKVLDATDVEYVIFKTIRPYPVVPDDVDILVLGDRDAYLNATEILIKAGYREVAARISVSPSLPDLIDPEGDIVIDLQEELELDYVIYLDKNKLRGSIVKRKIPSGAEITTLTPGHDLATVIIHSLTEYLYLLGEFYTFLYTLSNMDKRDINNFITVLEENKLTAAAASFVTLTVNLHEAVFGVIPEKLEYVMDKLGYEKIEAKSLVKNNFKMPHRYSILTVAKEVLEKMGERRFRRSVVLQLTKMLNPKVIKYMLGEIIERCNREYYLKNG